MTASDPAAVSADLGRERLGAWARYFELVRELSITQFKLKYTGSALGYVWSLIKPLMNFAVMYVVFDQFLHAGGSTPRFPIQLLVGIVWWGFFGETTNAALASIATNGALIKKAYFPRVILVIAATVTSLMTFFINLGLIVVIAGAFGGLDLRWSTLMVIPLMLEMYFFSLGLGLLLAALQPFYRDVGHLWEVFSQVLFYASGIVYSLQSIGPTASRVLALNPVAQMVNDVRHFLVAHEVCSTATIAQRECQPPYGSSTGVLLALVPFLLTVLVMALGWWVFKRRAPDFAEYL